MKKSNIIKCCGNCKNGVRICVNKDILCRINGVVSQDFVCSKYKLQPEPDKSSMLKYKCIDCEFFIRNEDAPQAYNYVGFCQLFTVRQYNGELKNACSKFSKIKERVS